MNANHTWIVALALFISGSSLRMKAQRRTEAEMQSIAARFFQGNTLRKESTGIKRTTARTTSTPRLVARSGQMMDTEEEMFAVYAPEESNGFVIVSTQQNQNQILGFSLDRNFDTTLVPPAMIELLQSRAPEDSIHQGITDVDANIEPMLGEIAYNQSAPFNNQCPQIGEDRTLTGCVATGMSQIMAYYRYPDQMTGDPISFVSKTYQVPVAWNPEATRFNWEDILPQYSGAYVPYEGGETLGNGTHFGTRSLTLSDGLIYLEPLRITNNSNFNGTIQAILATEDGTFIRPIGTEKSLQLNYNYFYQSYWFSWNSLNAITADFPDGNYRIYVATKPEGSSEWTLVQKIDSSNKILEGEAPYLTLSKCGTHCTVGDQDYYVAYTVDQANAVAQLSAACASSIEADFGVSSTAASITNMMKALCTNFGYDDGMYFTGSAYSATGFELESELLEELTHERPVLISADSEASGHCYVIDGITTLNDLYYFHCNWGWGGSGNGYFLLNLDHDQTDEVAINEYSYNFYYVANIKPGEGTGSPCTFRGTSLSPEKSQYTAGESLKIKVDKLSNRSVRTFSGNVLAYLVNESSGESRLLGTVLKGINLATGYYYSSLDRSYSLDVNLPEGTYEVQLRTQESGREGESIVRFATPGKITIGDTANAIESVRSKPKVIRSARYTLDGRKIPENAVYHGLQIRNGRTVWE